MYFITDDMNGPFSAAKRSYRWAPFIALLLAGCLSAPAIETSTPQELNDYANRLDDNGRSEEALAYYEAALQKYTPDQRADRAGCYYNYGLALRRLNRLDEAIEAYQQSLELDENRERTYVNYGMALDRAGHPAEAILVYRKGLKRFPDSLHLIENIAITLIQNDQQQEAVEYVKRAVQIRESRPGLADNPKYLRIWRRFLSENAQ